jgi:hypothetical protein
LGVAVLAGAAVAACGGGSQGGGGSGNTGGGGSLDAGPPDAGSPDAGPPDAGPPDAGPPDAGPPDAGPTPHIGVHIEAQDSTGWKFYTSADGLPGNVMGASADEGGRLWVAGGASGVFALVNGRFQQFTIADGLHPYGYMPDGSPSDNNPSLAKTPAISIAGGPANTAFVGYQGIENPSGTENGCEDEWDRVPDHQGVDPVVYKSGDADKVVLTGSGIRVAHYDISSGPNVVTAEPAGREKLCSVYRMVYDKAQGRIWFGANHGFAVGDVNFNGDPTCNGQLGCSGVLEHIHPAINAKGGSFMTGQYYGIAIDPFPHFDGAKNTNFFDVWFGGKYRTTRFRFGETLGDYFTAENLTELYTSKGHNPANIADDPAAQAAFWNRMDIWPDPIGERRDAAHGNWLSSEPDKNDVTNWDLDYVTGIAVLSDGTAWIGSHADPSPWRGSHTVYLRHVDHDGHFIEDAPAILLNKSIGALVKDPDDDSVWVGYREAGAGVSRLMANGDVIHYGPAALGGRADSVVWDLQALPGSPRQIIVAFRQGAVGVFTGK